MDLNGAETASAGGNTFWRGWPSLRASWLNTRSWTKACKAPSRRRWASSPSIRYAGVHLEKLQHSRDHQIRTIRIDSFWRGVVLAPESGDTYCLITVLPHDKANTYATSHRFSVNQAIGVLEVRDEAALEQLTPSLHDGRRDSGESIVRRR